MSKGLPEDGEIRRQWLPEDLAGLARAIASFGAISMQDARAWLRILLMHVAGALSFE